MRGNSNNDSFPGLAALGRLDEIYVRKIYREATFLLLFRSLYDGVKELELEEAISKAVQAAKRVTVNTVHAVMCLYSVLL